MTGLAIPGGLHPLYIQTSPPVVCWLTTLHFEPARLTRLAARVLCTSSRRALSQVCKVELSGKPFRTTERFLAPHKCNPPCLRASRLASIGGLLVPHSNLSVPQVLPFIQVWRSILARVTCFLCSICRGVMERVLIRENIPPLQLIPHLRTAHTALGRDTGLAVVQMPSYCLHDCHYFYRTALRLLSIPTCLAALYG